MNKNQDAIEAMSQKKGRPTPSRKEAEAARRRPLVPADRKEAKRREREHRNRMREAEQAALMNGDERHLPPQHRGQQRRFARNFVDARHNFGEYFLPVAMITLLIGFLLQLALLKSNPVLAANISSILMIVLWIGIAVTIIDTIVMRRKLKAALTEKFKQIEVGVLSYGMWRTLQIRPWRLPKPQVKHGEKF